MLVEAISKYIADSQHFICLQHLTYQNPVVLLLSVHPSPSRLCVASAEQGRGGRFYCACISAC